MAANNTGVMQRRGKRTWIVAAVVLGVVLALSSLGIPATRRWIANPTGQPAVVGATAVDVRGDWFQNHLYAPAVVQVPVGTTIHWTFNDRGAAGTEALVPHNVVGAGWASAVLTAGVYEHTFTAPGTYRYVCTLHRNMDGVVIVTE